MVGARSTGRSADRAAGPAGRARSGVERPAGAGTGTLPRWLPLTATVVAVAGLGVSVYMTYEHFTGSKTLACPNTGVINCAKVTSSPESVIFGVPMAILGLLFFAGMLALNLPAVWRRADSWLRGLRLAGASVGVLFVLYLLYVELFEVNAICLWCTAVHVLSFVLFVLVVMGTLLYPAPAATATAVRTPGKS